MVSSEVSELFTELNEFFFSFRSILIRIMSQSSTDIVPKPLKLTLVENLLSIYFLTAFKSGWSHFNNKSLKKKMIKRAKKV